MNTQIINAELALALRKCLPFVRRHAIISGGDGALTYAFAVRALADADARQQEEQRVKNIVEAEAKRRDIMRRFPTYRELIRQGAENMRMTATEVLRRQSPSSISGDEAMKQAARAVRPGEGYLPAAPPAKGCNCDTCTEARLRGIRRAGL